MIFHACATHTGGRRSSGNIGSKRNRPVFQIAALPDPNTTLEVVKNLAPVVGIAHQRFGGADRIREYRLGYQRM